MEWGETYTMLEKDGLINVEIIMQEIEEDWLDDDKELEEENPYQNMIINNFEKNNINRSMSQMKQWSFLSNVINFDQYTGNPRDYFKLEKKNHRKNV